MCEDKEKIRLRGLSLKIKRVTTTNAIDLRCRKCKGCHKNVEDQEERLHDDVETVTDYHIHAMEYIHEVDVKRL